MVSKKQRSKLTKGKRTTESDKATAFPGYNSALPVQVSTDFSTKISFLQFPRKVRDQVYEELLVRRATPEDHAELDRRLKAIGSAEEGEFRRDNAIDEFEHKLCIMPGGIQGYPFIVQALGLLLANKQVNAEATTVLFSKNFFAVAPSFKRTFNFWTSKNGSWLFSVSNLKQIKHLCIVVQNLRGLSDPMLPIESKNNRTNLKHMVDTFLMAGNKFTTLNVRYISCFGGEIDAIRSALEDPIPEGMPERPIVLKDVHGKNYHTSRAQATKRLFKYRTVLDPLRQLKAVAEEFKIRGDLPQAYMDELTNIITVPDVSDKIKEKRQAEAAAKEQRREARGGGMQAFFADMAEREEDEETATWARQMTRVAVKAPSVKAELFATPMHEEIRRLKHKYAAPAGVNNTVSEDDMQETILRMVVRGLEVMATHGW